MLAHTHVCTQSQLACPFNIPPLHICGMICLSNSEQSSAAVVCVSLRFILFWGRQVSPDLLYQCWSQQESTQTSVHMCVCACVCARVHAPRCLEPPHASSHTPVELTAPCRHFGALHGALHVHRRGHGDLSRAAGLRRSASPSSGL